MTAVEQGLWETNATAIEQAAASPEEINRLLVARARDLARRPVVADAGDITNVLVFTLGGETYAVDVSHVERIDTPQEITPVPCTPEFVTGLINLRGKILTVLDVHKLLGLEGLPAREGAQVIAVHAAGLEVGVLADQALGVRALSLSELHPALPSTTRVAAEYTRGVTPDMVVLLDLEALLASERVLVWEEVG